MTWRSIMTPPDRGATVLVKDVDSSGWEEKATMVMPNLWVSEVSGHIVYPTHWKELEYGSR